MKGHGKIVVVVLAPSVIPPSRSGTPNLRRNGSRRCPVGNGRLAGMLFTDEHLQFNENTLWTGPPHEYEYQHEGAVKYL
jgi:alpha-L-fucosidase 2